MATVYQWDTFSTNGAHQAAGKYDIRSDGNRLMVNPVDSLGQNVATAWMTPADGTVDVTWYVSFANGDFAETVIQGRTDSGAFFEAQGIDPKLLDDAAGAPLKITMSPPSDPVGPVSVGQYVARNVDNTAKDPQPGDVEITDAFGNVFDNFNKYGTNPGEVRFYDVDNVLLDPQPAYQNLGYTSRTVDNQPSSPAFEPDAAQWVCRNVENQERTPEPYVKSPLWPNGAPEWYNPVVGDTRRLRFVTVVLNVEDSEALIVTENDVSEIVLEINPLSFAQTRQYG